MYLSGHQTLVYPSVIIILATQALFCNCKALKLSCDSDNILEVVEETSNKSVTCSGLNQTNTVQWILDPLLIGTCTAPTNGEDTCTGKKLAPHFVPFRKVANESVMMINTTNLPDKNLEKNISLKCQISALVSAFCNVDLIFPSDGTCLAKFIRRDSLPWVISIECNITKVYSLLGRYQCDFFSAILNSETRVFSDKSPVLHSAAGKYKTFTCKFSANMPTVEGIYNYKAIITPGRKIITTTVEILKPSKSTVSCIPSPAVPENTNVTCTCNTTNIGKPDGRLSWYKGNNQIGTGKYGDNTLVMSQTLYRNDSDVTQFRCDVQWNTVVSGDSLKISVGCISTKTSEAGDQINGAVGGGIAASLVVITVIIIIGAVILKRRNKGKQDGDNVCVSLPTKTIAEDAERTARPSKSRSEEPHTTGDGTTYSKLDFSHCKKNNIAKPLPAEMHTDYATINFTK